MKKCILGYYQLSDRILVDSSDKKKAKPFNIWIVILYAQTERRMEEIIEKFYCTLGNTIINRIAVVRNDKVDKQGNCEIVSIFRVGTYNECGDIGYDIVWRAIKYLVLRTPATFTNTENFRRRNKKIRRL